MQKLAAVLVMLLLTSVTPDLIGASNYTVTDLGHLAGFVGNSEARAINNYGQVVGRSAGAFLWTPTTPLGTTGSMVHIGDIPGGASDSFAFAINDYGQVVGEGQAPTGQHGFLWTPDSPNTTSGSIIDLGDLPGGVDRSHAYGINALGQVVGEGEASTGARAFLWSPTTPNGTTGAIVDIGELPGGANASSAVAINESGQMAGGSNNLSGRRAFRWTPDAPNGSTGSMVSLGDLPGGVGYSTAYATNATGQVVGECDDATSTRAFLWTPDSPGKDSGTMIDLGDVPGSAGANAAYSINASGQVVGESVNNVAGQRAFLWTADDGMRDLNDLLDGSGADWTLHIAYGINDFGQIVGLGVHEGHSRGFLLTPVIPESSYLVLVSAIALPLIRRQPRIKAQHWEN